MFMFELLLFNEFPFYEKNMIEKFKPSDGS